MTRQEKEAILNDTLLRLRRLLDHSANICDCPSCEKSKEKLQMNKLCEFRKFKLPITLDNI